MRVTTGQSGTMGELGDRPADQARTRPGDRADETVLRKLAQAVAQSTAPRAVAAAFGTGPETRYHGTGASQRPGPEPGQCWRLLWDQQVALAVIGRVEDGYVSVIPVTTEPAAADESAVIWDGPDVPLGHPIVLWPALETGVGTWVLERHVIDLLPSADIVALRRWARRGDPLPVDHYWRPGLRASTPAHPRRLHRSRLIDAFNELGSADWLEDGWVRTDTDQGHETGLEQGQESASEQFTARQLQTVLGVTARQAISLASGRTGLTPEQSTRLELAGLRPSVGPGRQPGADVIAAIDHPSVRLDLLAVARLERIEEVALRQGLARRERAVAARRAPGQAQTQVPVGAGDTETTALALVRMELQRRLSARTPS